MLSRDALADVEFVDLYIGADYCDVKGLAGAHAPRVPAPAALLPAIDELREQCRRVFAQQGDPEFALLAGEAIYRVTAVKDVTDSEVFILRRSTAAIRPFQSLGFGRALSETLMDADTRGLVMVSGEMGSGKTSTAASIITERLRRHGGIAIAIEDPNETRLNGLHGEGRCIQIRASRKTGGYKEQIVRAMRSGADMMLIGEIRDEDTASLVLQASVNGHYIVSTLHAGDIPQAVGRLQAMTLPRHVNAAEILAEGLSVVLWQHLEKVGPSARAAVRLRVQSLVLATSAGARQRIRAGAIEQLANDVEDQARRAAWSGQQ